MRQILEKLQVISTRICPKKDQIRTLMQECDMDLDGGLNREEFEEFVKRLTADTFVYVTQGLLITLAIAPTVAISHKEVNLRCSRHQKGGSKATHFRICKSYHFGSYDDPKS